MNQVQKIMIGLLALFLAGEAAAVTELQVKDAYQEDGRALVRVQGLLRGSPEKIWNDLIRFNDYSDFMPRVSVSFYITEAGVQKIRDAMGSTMNANRMKAIAASYKTEMPRQEGEAWNGLVFMVLDTPFPVENRWYVLKTFQDESRNSENIYKRCWNLVVGNIDSSKGCWYLEPEGNGTETFARYEDSVNPGGHVPRWVSRMAARETMPAVFRVLEKRASADLP